MENSSESELWRYLRSQRDLATRLIDADTLDEAAPGFLSTVGDLLRWEAGALWEVVEAAPELRFVSGWSASGLNASPLWAASREAPFERGHGMPGRAWEGGEIVSLTDYNEAAAHPRRAHAEALGFTAALAIPIPVGPPEEVLAVAEFHTCAFDLRSAALIALLTGFADQLAGFITRSRDRAEAERVRQHMTEVVRGTGDAVMSKDLRGVVTSWNPAAERLYGYSAEEAIGRHISFIVPPDHKNEEMEILARVVAGERLETYETERIRADGARIDVSLTVSQIRSPLHGVLGAAVVARDITAEKRRRRARDFLVGASRLLERSLDPAQTARTIVATAVPELAELCVMDFVRPDGTLGDSVVAGADPQAAARLEKIRRDQPLDPDGEHPVAQVLREERPMIWRDLTAPDVVEKIAQNPAHRQLMDDAGYNSAAVVALVARGRTLGALSFLHARSDLRYDPDDLDFLAELGDRAAMALDNARLYSERDEIARNLQRGLRPPRPAEVPGLDISVVFEAAGEGIEIGGDLYDVLPTEDGCWILVGDVAGKGSAAAGVSVAVRHSVRGLTREVDEPEEVLMRVNELLLGGETLNDFATAMLLRLRRRRDGRRAPPAGRRGGARRLAECPRGAPRDDDRPGGDACPLHRRLARGRPGCRPPRPGGAGGDGPLARRPGAGDPDHAAARRRRRPRRRQPSRRPGRAGRAPHLRRQRHLRGGVELDREVALHHLQRRLGEGRLVEDAVPRLDHEGAALARQHRLDLLMRPWRWARRSTSSSAKER